MDEDASARIKPQLGFACDVNVQKCAITYIGFVGAHGDPADSLVHGNLQVAVDMDTTDGATTDLASVNRFIQEITIARQPNPNRRSHVVEPAVNLEFDDGEVIAHRLWYGVPLRSIFRTNSGHFTPPRPAIQLTQDTSALLERFYQSSVDQDPLSASHSFLRMTYFSAVTVTTLGFGDIVPLTGRARLYVTLESIAGVIIIGLFLNSLASRFVRPG